MADSPYQRLDQAASSLEDARDSFFEILTADDTTDVPVTGYADQPSLAKRSKTQIEAIGATATNAAAEAAASAAEAAAILDGTLQTVATLAELVTFGLTATTGASVKVKGRLSQNDGYQGAFIKSATDYSALVALDEAQGIVIDNGDGTYMIRDYGQAPVARPHLDLNWFGAGRGLPDADTAAFKSAINVANYYVTDVHGGAGEYTINECLPSITKTVKLVFPGSGSTMINLSANLLTGDGVSGWAFSFNDTWRGQNNAARAVTYDKSDYNERAGLIGVTINGTRDSNQGGIACVGRIDGLQLRDVEVAFCKRGGFTAGVMIDGSGRGYIRESTFTDVLIRGCGNGPSTPGFVNDSAGTTGENSNNMEFFSCRWIFNHGPVLFQATGTRGATQRYAFHGCQFHGLNYDGMQNGTGTHDGSNDAATLVDSGASWTVDEFVGEIVTNLTDGSDGIVTANTATTITATLSGGTGNDWDSGDSYAIGGGNNPPGNGYFPIVDLQGDIEGFEFNAPNFNGSLRGPDGTYHAMLRTESSGGNVPQRLQIYGVESRNCQGGVFEFNALGDDSYIQGTIQASSVMGPELTIGSSCFSREGFEYNVKALNNSSRNYNIDTSQIAFIKATLPKYGGISNYVDFNRGTFTRLASVNTLAVSTVTIDTLPTLSDKVYRFRAEVVGNIQGGTDVKSTVLEGLIHNAGGTPTIVGTTTVVSDISTGASAATWVVSLAISGSDVLLQVKGAAATTVHWDSKWTIWNVNPNNV